MMYVKRYAIISLYFISLLNLRGVRKDNYITLIKKEESQLALRLKEAGVSIM